MRKTALKWELAGLLHDADWEKHPDGHCRIIIEKTGGDEYRSGHHSLHCLAWAKVFRGGTSKTVWTK